ncbi:unnamed protein product [Eruca vesicaria subsp. sativa]|uniref:Uncharacterized protein n=1 Tax=Eruca vesicaria subsp. sativa TaxID=29727 RepID=A0ABC8IUY0_ERUVS|nr:unnamed protein product [Eruca vesicaria subsp. sativa]
MTCNECAEEAKKKSAKAEKSRKSASEGKKMHNHLHTQPFEEDSHGEDIQRRIQSTVLAVFRTRYNIHWWGFDGEIG